jgi:hypothetical protein
VHDAHPLEARLLVGVQRLVARVRVRELGLSALLGDHGRGEHRCHLWALVVHRDAPVDVPEERALQDLGARVHLGVERDLDDTGHVGEAAFVRRVDLADAPAERNLGLRIEVQLTEHEHTVRFERIDDGRRVVSSLAIRSGSASTISAPTVPATSRS